MLNALIGVGVGMAGLFALSGVVELTTTAPMLALMLGLAVGIDYSLFITSRHRQNLLDGLPPDEAVGRAVGTAGSAVRLRRCHRRHRAGRPVGGQHPVPDRDGSGRRRPRSPSPSWSRSPCSRRCSASPAGACSPASAGRRRQSTAAADGGAPAADRSASASAGRTWSSGSGCPSSWSAWSGLGVLALPAPTCGWRCRTPGRNRSGRRRASLLRPDQPRASGRASTAASPWWSPGTTPQATAAAVAAGHRPDPGHRGRRSR